MRKRLILVAIAASALLAACEEETIIYKNIERPMSDVEEIIADELEVENPALDLELDIYRDTDD